MTKYFTQQGLDKLKKELEYLTKVKRREIARDIKKAVSFGDLSENAAYTQSKDDKAFNEGRIQELEKMLTNAKIVEKGNQIEIKQGTTVILEAEGNKQELTIVSPAEADFDKGMISFVSPIGRALLGKKKGDKIKAPNGMEYKVIELL